MPTSLFEHLPKDKQTKIMDAAIKEFSLCTYEAASINSIIKDADISRGSFYLYFQDKEDLYVYVMKTSFEYAVALFMPILKNDKLSINDKVGQIFEQVMVYGKEAKLFVKALMNMKYAHHEIVAQKVNELLEKIGVLEKNQLNNRDRRIFLELVTTNFVMSCFNVLIKGENPQEEKEILQEKLIIIEKGMTINV